MRERIKPLLITLSALTFALTVGYGACVEDKGLDVETWEVRDMLGLGPAWFDDLSDPQREDLQSRLQTQIRQQADEGASVTLTRDETLDAPQATLTPRRAISALDERLDTMAQPPILIQWNRYRDEGHTTPTATACPLTDADFGPDWPEGTGKHAARWTLDEDFDRPLDPTDLDGSGPTERQQLEARLPMIERWIERCVDNLDDDLADHGHTEALEVRRARGAPALISWWPRGRRVYINPALLMLWHPEGDQPDLRALSQSQQIANNPYDACISDTIDYCVGCDTEEEVSRNLCDDPLFEGGDALESCQTITSIEEGIQRFCVNESLASFGDSLRQCIMTRTSNNEACTLGPPAATADELSRSFSTFVTIPDCITALRLCLEVDDDPEPDFMPPPPPEPEFEPEPFPEDDTSNECSDDCAELICHIGAEVLCASLADGDCDDGGDGGSDGGGCEGDTTDDPGCCEGD